MEIRFRVWDGEKMHYPDDSDMGQGVCMLTMEGAISYRIAYDIEVEHIAMLSTGLKDANEKEIWEGDVIGVQYAKVVELAGFLGYHYWLTQESGRDITYHVVGNIHENPELLEEVA